jgi:hypothetical protein
MTPSRLFIAHEALDVWVADGRAEIDAEGLVDHETSRRFALTEAVRFLEEVTGAPDAPGLVGKVKSLAQVAEMGGEHMADSVILGETAYRVQPGFMGVLRPAEGVVTPPPLPASGLKGPRGPRDSDDPMHAQTLAALQKFFLNNVK